VQVAPFQSQAPRRPLLNIVGLDKDSLCWIRKALLGNFHRSSESLKLKNLRGICWVSSQIAYCVGMSAST